MIPPPNRRNKLMAKKIRVALSTDSLGSAKEIEQVEPGVIRFANDKGSWFGPSSHQLLRLLGNGFMDKSFHLIVGDVGLANCQIVEAGAKHLGGIGFWYDGTFPGRSVDRQRSY